MVKDTTIDTVTPAEEVTTPVPETPIDTVEGTVPDETVDPVDEVIEEVKEDTPILEAIEEDIIEVLEYTKVIIDEIEVLIKK